MEDTLPRIYMDLMPAKYYKKITIKDETGLLYYDLRFESVWARARIISGTTAGR